MRNSAFCICENKGADHLQCFKPEPFGRLASLTCLCYIDINSIPLLPKSKILKPLAIVCGCTAPVCVRPTRKPQSRFSQDAAHMVLYKISLPFALQNIASDKGQNIMVILY